MTFWTLDRVEVLKKLWAEGRSGSFIAQTLGGTTCKAVISKVHRLGVADRIQPQKGDGRKRMPEYALYRSMIARCENPKATSYHRYGGRGIRVCQKWRNDFQTFLADLGRRPSPEHQLDRINVNGHYEPLNVRWATVQAQANNRRSTRMVFYRGRELPLADAVREAGSLIHIEAAWGRISKYGWTVEAAVETPRRHQSPSSQAGRGSARTHCVNGLPFSPENTRSRKRGGVVCRTCENAAQRACRRRQKEKAA